MALAKAQSPLTVHSCRAYNALRCYNQPTGSRSCAALLEPSAPCSHRKEALKEAFTALMTADAGKVAGAIDALAARLTKEAATRKLTAKEQLILRLNEQYPKVKLCDCCEAHSQSPNRL